MLRVIFTTTEENKVILAECQQSFEYLTTRHCSLVNINTILCADILKPLRKKVKNKKYKNMWQYQQSVETHCPKGLPYNVKGNRKFKHFQCNIVPLFKLPVKKINTQTLNGGERGRVWIVLFSVKLPHLRTCTQQLCRRLEKWPLDNILIIMM